MKEASVAGRVMLGDNLGTEALGDLPDAYLDGVTGTTPRTTGAIAPPLPAHSR